MTSEDFTASVELASREFSSLVPDSDVPRFQARADAGLNYPAEATSLLSEAFQATGVHPTFHNEAELRRAVWFCAATNRFFRTSDSPPEVGALRQHCRTVAVVGSEPVAVTTVQRWDGTAWRDTDAPAFSSPASRASDPSAPCRPKLRSHSYNS